MRSPYLSSICELKYMTCPFLLVYRHFGPNPKHFDHLWELKFGYSVVLFFVIKKSTFLFKFLCTPGDVALDRVVIGMDVEVLEEIPALREHSATEITLKSSKTQVVECEVPSQDETLRVDLVAVGQETCNLPAHFLTGHHFVERVVQVPLLVFAQVQQSVMSFVDVV